MVQAYLRIGKPKQDTPQEFIGKVARIGGGVYTEAPASMRPYLDLLKQNQVN